MAHVLRDVAESDLDAFYEHQREPEATEMALFPARDREAFDAHWQRLLADDSLIKKTIVHDGQVAGNIGCWEQDGRRLIGYWVGKEFWGRGLATRALAEFVEDLPRPLHAWVAGSNVGSIRVLEKCGFVAVGSRTEHDENFGRPVEEVLYELAQRSSRQRKQVVVWSISQNPTAVLRAYALEMAVEQREAARGETVIHNDHDAIYRPTLHA